MESASAVFRPEVSSVFPEAEVHAVPTSDGTEVRLTRYRMGTKGPVVLAPGYGNAARAFALDTVPKSFVQYLGEHDYDVWLLDYRASPDLPSSHTQFTVDDIALRDWPAAVDTIRRETGQDEIQALGIKGLNTDYDPRSLPDKAIEAVMKVLPFRHVYDDPVARRIYFIYGDVFDYENIDEDTMRSSVPSFFGNGNITFFEHISLMIRAGEARNARGEDVYVSNLDAYKLPINFMTGEHNRMFVPQGLQRTYDTLRKGNGPEQYRHTVVQDYAHLDLWLGTNAERDVFPTALAELERHN